MRVRGRSLWGVSVLLLVGCPPPPADSPPPAASSPSPLPTAVATPSAPSAPTVDAESPNPSEADGRIDRIAPGTVLRPQPELSIGLVEVTRNPEALAWLSVGRGAYSFRASLRRGERLYVAGGELEVSELTPGGEVVVRWLTSVPTAGELDPVASGEVQELPDMGLYRLPDGRVLGVGNVRRSAAVGEEPELGVTLALYPSGYARDPSLGYDLHEEARAGTLKGELGEIQLERVELARPPERGRVVLRIP